MSDLTDPTIPAPADTPPPAVVPPVAAPPAAEGTTPPTTADLPPVVTPPVDVPPAAVAPPVVTPPVPAPVDVPAPLPPTTAVDPVLASVLNDVVNALDTITARLTDLEKRPVAVATGTVAPALPALHDWSTPPEVNQLVRYHWSDPIDGISDQLGIVVEVLPAIDLPDGTKEPARVVLAWLPGVSGPLHVSDITPATE